MISHIPTRFTKSSPNFCYALFVEKKMSSFDHKPKTNAKYPSFSFIDYSNCFLNKPKNLPSTTNEA